MLTRLLLALLLAVTASAQSNVVGTWKLVSATQFNADGTIVPEQFGPHPSGFLTYTADGHMHAILTEGARPPLSVDDRVAAPEAERAQAFATGFAYAGTYTVTGDKVTHKVLVSTISNWVGQDFVRRFQLDGDRLTIVTEGAMLIRGVKVDHVELVWQREPGPSSAPLAEPKVVVLAEDEGEKRVRRPREGVEIPTSEFILKITPQNSGSQHLVLGTETIPPSGVIPKHQHLEQDEILILQTGSARVTLNDKDYDVKAGGTVFFPARTWVSLKNTGTEPIKLIFFFSAPGFEDYMRCTSTPAGEEGAKLTRAELQACAHKGHVEYGALQDTKK